MQCLLQALPVEVEPGEILAQAVGVVGGFAVLAHYLQKEGGTAGRAEFIAILDGYLQDRGFCSDMEPLLRSGVRYDPQMAGRHVKEHLLSLLPE